MEDFLGFTNIILLGMLVWGLIKPKKIFLPKKFNKNRLNVFIFYFVLFIISLTLFNIFYNKQNDIETTNIQEIKTIVNKNATLSDYKNSSDRNNLLLALLKNNISNVDFTHYKNCVGDFVYQKDRTLALTEIIEWCDNEKLRNKRSFYSHINELEVRENGNYKISFDENIALLKKQKLNEATQLSIEWEEKTYIGKIQTIKKKVSPFKALEDFGGLYTAVEISKNEVILYTPYYANDEEEWILESAKRNFIDGVFQSFIHTDVDYIKIGIFLQENETKKQHRFSFQGSIKRKDALNVAKKLLHIESFNDLVEIKVFDDGSGQAVFNNPIMNRIKFNDAGTPTLNIFFEELSKVTY